MTSQTKLYKYLSDSVKAFQTVPADTRFLKGYELAIVEWKRWIHNGFLHAQILLELQSLRGLPGRLCAYKYLR